MHCDGQDSRACAGDRLGGQASGFLGMSMHYGAEYLLGDLVLRLRLAGDAGINSQNAMRQMANLGTGWMVTRSLGLFAPGLVSRCPLPRCALPRCSDL